MIYQGGANAEKPVLIYVKHKTTRKIKTLVSAYSRTRLELVRAGIRSTIAQSLRGTRVDGTS